jgi:hypothetical protein
LRIATQLGGALDFAAAVNVFHGSLHPRDVLVSVDDTRVTGLGIAHALEQVGLLPPIRRPYTAPERVAGLAWDRRADTFSLAALVYEMLFGRRIAGLGRDAADAIPSMEGLDVHGMRTLFARALAEDPAERFETALGFADALHNAVAQPASSTPAPKSGRGRRKAAVDAPLPPRATGPALPLEPEPDLPLAHADALALDLAPAAPPELSQAQAPETARTFDPEPHELPPLSPLSQPVPQFEPELPSPARDEFALADAPIAPGDDAALNADDVPPVSIDRRAVDHPPQEFGFSSAEPAFDDVELRRAEADRYALVDDGLSALPDAESATGIDVHPVEEPARPVAAAARPAEPESVAPNSPAPTFSSVALEESRSAIWPIALALALGLLVGFAFGYGAGTRARGSAAPQQASAEVPQDSAAAGPNRVQPEAAPTRTAPPSGASQPEVITPSASAPPAVPPAARPRAAAPERAAPERTTPERTTPERPAGERGRLLVRSTPAGARVLLDGRDVGETPLTLGTVAFGTHVVRIAHQGYVAAERRVRIRSAQPAQSIEVELVATRPARGTTPSPAAPERTSGSLMVDSRPAGARVFVDGRLVGTTPLLLDTVSAGEHAVRLEMDGFSTWSTTTRVMGGERNRVSGSLEQQ